MEVNGAVTSNMSLLKTEPTKHFKLLKDLLENPSAPFKFLQKMKMEDLLSESVNWTMLTFSFFGWSGSILQDLDLMPYCLLVMLLISI